MNLIPEIAKMLNVEIGEEFKLLDTSNHDNGLFRLGENYIEQKSKDGKWSPSYDYIIGAIVCGRLKVVKLPDLILTEKEKEYLSSVIEPYRDDVVCIIKSDVFEHPRVYIHLKHDIFGLPWFEKDTMYKGMEFEKRYSLEDLGL